MSRFFIKGKYFTSEHIWFESNIENNSKCDYIVIHGISNLEYITDIKDCIVYKQETLISDLTQNEEELYLKLSKTNRNEINRSKKEEIHIKVWSSDEIIKKNYILEDFAIMYSNMYKEKGLTGHILNINELKAYAQAGSLIITTASINNSIVVYHSYIKDEKHSRLLHSCSEFRVSDNKMKNAIGRANKYLHWNDFIYLKSIGIQEYDWGGVSSFKNPNGIDKFKLAFGGYEKTYYNIKKTYSFRAKVYQKIKRISNIVLDIIER